MPGKKLPEDFCNQIKALGNLQIAYQQAAADNLRAAVDADGKMLALIEQFMEEHGFGGTLEELDALLGLLPPHDWCHCRNAIKSRRVRLMDKMNEARYMKEDEQ